MWKNIWTRIYMKNLAFGIDQLHGESASRVGIGVPIPGVIRPGKDDLLPLTQSISPLKTLEITGLVDAWLMPLCRLCAFFESKSENFKALISQKPAEYNHAIKLKILENRFEFQ